MEWTQQKQLNYMMPGKLLILSAWVFSSIMPPSLWSVRRNCDLAAQQRAWHTGSAWWSLTPLFILHCSPYLPHVVDPTYPFFPTQLFPPTQSASNASLWCLLNGQCQVSVSATPHFFKVCSSPLYPPRMYSSLRALASPAPSKSPALCSSDTKHLYHLFWHLNLVKSYKVLWAQPVSYYAIWRGKTFCAA